MSTRVSVYWEGYDDTFYCLDGMSERTLKNALGLYGEYDFDKEKHLSEDVIPALNNLIAYLQKRKQAYERASEFIWQNPNFKFGKILTNLLDSIIAPDIDGYFAPEMNENYTSDYAIINGYIERLGYVVSAIAAGQDVVAIYA